VRADQGDIDAPGDQRLERRISGWLVEAVKATVLEVRNARRKLEAQQCAEREDMIGVASAIRMASACCDIALVIEQSIQTPLSIVTSGGIPLLARASIAASRSSSNLRRPTLLGEQRGEVRRRNARARQATEQ